MIMFVVVLVLTLLDQDDVKYRLTSQNQQIKEKWVAWLFLLLTVIQTTRYAMTFVSACL